MLMCAFVAQTVCNVLLILNKIDLKVAQIAFLILLLIVFLVSAFGLALKNIRKESRVTVNILTPAGEFGRLYAIVLLAWAITYFITVIFFM